MGVRHRLASVFSRVSSDIETGNRGVCLLDLTPSCLEQFVNGNEFGLVKTKKISYVSFRDYQHVKFRDRVQVACHIAKSVFQFESMFVYFAERATCVNMIGHRRLCNMIIEVFAAAHHVSDRPIIPSVFTSSLAMLRF